MTRDASIAFDWADGEHRFRLALGQLRELQEKTGASPFEIFERLSARRPMVDDLREVLRLGLTGGGLAPVEALRLVRTHVDERPLAEAIVPALTVLAAALFGPAEDEPGKSPGAAPAAKASPPTDG